MSALNVVVRKTSHPTTGAGRYEVKWRDRAGHKHTRHVPYRHDLDVTRNHRQAILAALKVETADIWSDGNSYIYLDEWTGRIVRVPDAAYIYRVAQEGTYGGKA